MQAFRKCCKKKHSKNSIGSFPEDLKSVSIVESVIDEKPKKMKKIKVAHDENKEHFYGDYESLKHKGDYQKQQLEIIYKELEEANEKNKILSYELKESKDSLANKDTQKLKEIDQLNYHINDLKLENSTLIEKLKNQNMIISELSSAEEANKSLKAQLRKITEENHELQVKNTELTQIIENLKTETSEIDEIKKKIQIFQNNNSSLTKKLSEISLELGKKTQELQEKEKLFGDEMKKKQLELEFYFNKLSIDKIVMGTVDSFRKMRDELFENRKTIELVSNENTLLRDSFHYNDQEDEYRIIHQALNEEKKKILDCKKTLFV